MPVPAFYYLRWMKIKDMEAFNGIQVYEILENGNLLNAIYTNRDLLKAKCVIDNEIARKKVYDNKGIEGSYDCSYLETGNPLVTVCELEILKYNNGVYEFTWTQGSEVRWTGLGLMAGSTHIAVSYS
jgi:hypothetical protein